MKNLIAAVFVSLAMLLSKSAAIAASDEITVENAWVREAPPFSNVLGAYLMVKNSSQQARVLSGATTPSFERVEMHKTEIKDGVASMIRQKALDIPANGSLLFESGGYHLMLIGPVKPLHAGDKVEMSLQFANGDVLPFSAEVRKDMEGMGANKEMKGMGSMDMNTMPGMGDMKNKQEIKMDGM